EWIQKIMCSSLRVGRGCSGSFVSPTGLVLTNHHCVRRCVQALSSKRHNLIADGFLANSREKELRCPDLELNRLEQITDVSDVLKSATQGKTGEEFAMAYSS